MVSYVDSVVAPSPGEVELVLPGFIVSTPDGVHVDMSRLPSPTELERIVDRIFITGHLLRGLDYQRFQEALYALEPPTEGLVRIAAEIVEFPPERRPLYRPVKMAGEQAEYMFEPAQLEKTIMVPLFTTGDDGVEFQSGVEEQTIFEPTSLDFDEFIACAWGQGLKFGIDAAKVRDLIASGRTERTVIAHARPPTKGVDAGILEQSDALHRNNAPARRADGRVDLQQFTNRFPQIREGTRLLMKTPRLLGLPGRKLDGASIEPDLPADLDLETLAGEGTRIERDDGCEYLVADHNGFLDVDTATNKISITVKIINREGVSARTTGNLVLEGDEYEEYGEVQEGRTIQGKSLTFHVNVYGKILSTGGTIQIEQNLVGGMAANREGDIIVKGLASNAHLQTAAGVIRVARAENAVLVADRVEVEWAAQCTILAETVEIGTAQGCAIAGKCVHIAVTQDHSGEETLVSMLLPDLSGFDRLQENDQRYIGECEDMIAQMKRGLSVLASHAETQHYLSMAGSLRRKEITLTPQQQSQWQQMVAKMAPIMKRMQRARDDIAALVTEVATVRERIAKYEADRRDAGCNIECKLDEVHGDTRVRPKIIPLDAPPLARLSPKELRAKLRGLTPGEPSLFVDNSGSFSWSLLEPETPVSQEPG
ncbi:MAG: flagellar assembly protein A [Betaproteobacteria bacterium]